MGKAFEKELEKIDETFKWSISLDLSGLQSAILSNVRPMLVVGSGGSLTACHYACCLLQQRGILAKPVTPLELFYSRHTIKQSNLLFISASGKNTDILFSYSLAVKCEPTNIFSICMKKNSPLGKLAMQTSFAHHVEFDNPSGKDGFLATNSLIAFSGVLYKMLAIESEDTKDVLVDQIFLKKINSYLSLTSKNFTFTVLYGGWGQPVAVDLESKIAEAALANILLSDFRNFGHGRHHWFAKRIENSAIIALITPQEKELAEKTLSLLPKEIPVLRIETDNSNAFSTIELLAQAFHFIERLGKIQNIDPGRPGVPEFGSRLYKLNYARLYREPKEIFHQNVCIAILRKTQVSSLDILSEQERNYWHDAYLQFKNKLVESSFGSLVFDYDGTLCSRTNQYTGISLEIKSALINLLEQGLIIGIATGRGKSVREDLFKTIPKKFHEKVLIGYYNCGDIATLATKEHPNKNASVSPTLKKIFDTLISYSFSTSITPELKPNQITIGMNDKLQWLRVRMTITQLILNMQLPNVQILESSHSIDIIDTSRTSKLNIISACTNLSKKLGVGKECLCIGDKGQWPGNDYLLLSTPYSLSVDEVSSISNSCWNLCPPGIKNVEATLYYIKCIKFNKNGINIQLP